MRLAGIRQSSQPAIRAAMLAEAYIPEMRRDGTCAGRGASDISVRDRAGVDGRKAWRDETMFAIRQTLPPSAGSASRRVGIAEILE